MYILIRMFLKFVPHWQLQSLVSISQFALPHVSPPVKLMSSISYEIDSVIWFRTKIAFELCFLWHWETCDINIKSSSRIKLEIFKITPNKYWLEKLLISKCNYNHYFYSYSYVNVDYMITFQDTLSKSTRKSSHINNSGCENMHAMSNNRYILS